MRILTLTVTAATAAFLAMVTLRAQSTTPASGKTILFLAGPKDHGIAGRHEYEQDLRTLAHCLETSSNLKGVTTRVVVGRAPRDLAEYKDVAAIVIESSSDRDERETHPLFPPEPTTTKHTYDADTLQFLKDLDARVKQGMGVVIIHYASWVEHWVARRYYLDWTGGLWVQGGSRNPVDQWSMTLASPAHPILRGVKPWTYRDEMFSRYFLPTDPNRTDLLMGTPAKAPFGPQVASWAYERDGGGRGVVFGGMDFHDNLGTVDDFRRFLLNAITWAAGLEVPAGGVQSTVAVEPSK